MKARNEPLRQKFTKNTCLNGSFRAFIVAHKYEEVMPMDLLPEALIKSCLYQDVTEMEGLGIYEVAPEDLALCEYICPSKFEWQKQLRTSLDYVEAEG